MMTTIALLATLAGDLPWVQGLDAATNRGKPVLLLQLLGDFTDVHC